MKYEIDITNQFKKDLKLARKQGKNEDRLWEVVESSPTTKSLIRSTKTII